MSSGGSRNQFAMLVRTVKILLTAVGLLLFLHLGLILIHSVGTDPLVYRLLASIGAMLGLLSLTTLVLGVVVAYLRYPALRKPILFLVIVTTVVLAAHLYVVNNPALPDCRDSTKGVNGCVMDEVSARLHVILPCCCRVLWRLALPTAAAGVTAP